MLVYKRAACSTPTRQRLGPPQRARSPTSRSRRRRAPPSGRLRSPRRRSTCSGWIGSALTQRACSLGTRTLECFDCMFEGMCNLLFPGYPRLEPKFWSLARAARKIFFAAAQYICTAFILSVPWSPWPFIWFWDPKSVPSFELLLHELVLVRLPCPCRTLRPVIYIRAGVRGARQLPTLDSVRTRALLTTLSIQGTRRLSAASALHAASRLRGGGLRSGAAPSAP